MTSLVRRGVIAAAALIIYGAVASWVVSREGRSYREAFRAVASEPITEATDARPAPPVATPAPAPIRPVEVARTTPDLARPEAGSTAKPPEIARPATPEPPWDSAGVKKVWDLDHITADDEAGLGQVMDDLVRALNTPSEDAALNTRLQAAAEPLREKCGRKDISYTFTVLESDAFNAFSLPGGYIYVTRGLLNAIGEDEDYALQFVLAHEMAHVELHHALICLSDPKLRSNPTLGTAEIYYKFVIPLSYPDEMDFEADRRALDCMASMGRGKHESLAFLRKMNRFAQANNFAQGRVKPKAGRDRSVVDNHLRAHVGVMTRLSKADAYLKSKSAPPTTPAR
jgi:hypothetical protein